MNEGALLGNGFGMGAQRSCRWVYMQELGWKWVCFNLDGQPISISKSALAGAYPCIPRPDVKMSQTSQNTVSGGAASPQLSPSMPYGQGTKYCDEVTIIDEAIHWVKENPVTAAGIAIGAFTLLPKLFK